MRRSTARPFQFAGRAKLGNSRFVFICQVEAVFDENADFIQGRFDRRKNALTDFVETFRRRAPVSEYHIRAVAFARSEIGFGGKKFALDLSGPPRKIGWHTRLRALCRL